MKTFTNYTFHMTTEMVFGRDTESRVGELIRKYGGTKVLFVYGSGSIRKSGLYGRVAGALNEAGLPFVELGGVKANPLRSGVDEGIRLAQSEGADFFLAAGGGSVIDTAKAIAVAAANGGEYWSFFNGREPKAMAPVGAINTIAAAGSETSGSSVIVDDVDTGLKKSLFWDVCRPAFAIMNPELTYTVPAYQTAAGAADIFAHTFMRFFNPDASYLGDEYCIGTLRTVVKFAPVAVAEPENYEARAELMAAAAFSHNDLTGIGRLRVKGGGEHNLEQQLSAHYDTAHGAGLAVMMPAYLRYMVRHGTEEQVERVAYLGARVFGIEPADTGVRAVSGQSQGIAGTGVSKAVAEAGIAAFTAWLRSIGMPTTLRELPLPEDEAGAAAERCIEGNGGRIARFMEIDAEGVREIYRDAW